jgi:hypothetical protein
VADEFPAALQGGARDRLVMPDPEPLTASTARIRWSSIASSMRQKPTRLPYSCHAQFGMSGIGAPPAGGVSTVRGIGSRGFHSSTLTMTQTTSRALSGSMSRGRCVIAEYSNRSVGSMVGGSLPGGQTPVMRLIGVRPR